MTTIKIPAANVHIAFEPKLNFQKPGMHFHFGNTAGNCPLFMYRHYYCEHNNHCVLK